MLVPADVNLVEAALLHHRGVGREPELRLAPLVAQLRPNHHLGRLADRARFAPLLLIPVNLDRQSAAARFKIRCSDEEIATVFEATRRVMGIVLPIIVLVFLLYGVYGQHAPVAVLQHPGTGLYAHGSHRGETIWCFWGRANAWTAVISRDSSMVRSGRRPGSRSAREVTG